jgi:hypothetical protein
VKGAAIAQRPLFDTSKLSTADRILLGGSALFVIDSFLPWQRFCSPGVGEFPGECVNFSLWSGDASLLGVLAGLAAILLLIGGTLTLAKVAMPLTIPASTVLTWLSFGTTGFAILKFLFVMTNDAGYGAYIGLVLALAIAYGGWMKMQEARVLPPPAVGGGTEPRPYNP